MSARARFVAFAIAGVVAGAGRRAAADPPRVPSARQLIDLGRAIFFDTGLSQPAGTSCASCHDPARSFSGTNGSRLGVPRNPAAPARAVPDLGLRNVPVRATW